MIIGVTGTNGAGKGVLVDYLRDQKGFTHYSVRDLIVEEVLRQELPLSRTTIGEMGTAMRHQNEPAYFAKTFLERAHDNGIENVVIESIRTVAEAEYIQKKAGYVIAVDAPVELRYERIVARGTVTDKVSFEEFRVQEDAEYLAKDPTDPAQMSVLKVMDIADYVITNDGALEELHQKAEQVLADITK